MPMIDTGLTEGDLLAALLSEIDQSPHFQEGDVYLAQLTEATGRNRLWLTRFLREKVRNGELVEIKNVMLPNRRVGSVWRKA